MTNFIIVVILIFAAFQFGDYYLLSRILWKFRAQEIYYNTWIFVQMIVMVDTSAREGLQAASLLPRLHIPIMGCVYLDITAHRVLTDRYHAQRERLETQQVSWSISKFTLVFMWFIKRFELIELEMKWYGFIQSVHNLGSQRKSLSWICTCILLSWCIVGGVSEDDCMACPGGFYCKFDGLTDVTGPCSAGYYCPVNETIISPDPGEFLCPVGFFCNVQSSLPTPCPSGKFQNNAGSSICENCPAGFFCYGSTNPTQDPCPPHSYCPEGKCIYLWWYNFLLIMDSCIVIGPIHVSKVC